jgi:hypothetical protein
MKYCNINNSTGILFTGIFRLCDMLFTAENIRHKPQFIRHLTNKYIYSNLPEGTVVRWAELLKVQRASMYLAIL